MVSPDTPDLPPGLVVSFFPCDPPRAPHAEFLLPLPFLDLLIPACPLGSAVNNFPLGWSFSVLPIHQLADATLLEDLSLLRLVQTVTVSCTTDALQRSRHQVCLPLRPPPDVASCFGRISFPGGIPTTGSRDLRECLGLFPTSLACLILISLGDFFFNCSKSSLGEARGCKNYPSKWYWPRQGAQGLGAHLDQLWGILDTN